MAKDLLPTKIAAPHGTAWLFLEFYGLKYNMVSLYCKCPVYAQCDIRVIVLSILIQPPWRALSSMSSYHTAFRSRKIWRPVLYL